MKKYDNQLERIQTLYLHERNQWAQMLHDDFGQSLAAIRSFAAGIKTTPDIDNEVGELANIIEITANELYTQCYDLMLGLRLSLNLGQHLVDDVRVCIANSHLESQGVKLELCSGIAAIKINDIVKMVVLRVFQDSLRCILRLARAQKIFVNLNTNNVDKCTNNSDLKQFINLQIRVEVESKHAQMNVSENFDGVGQYASAFGGEFTVDESDDFGFSLMLKIDITDFVEENLK